MTGQPAPYKDPSREDCVEAELVDDGAGARRSAGERRAGAGTGGAAPGAERPGYFAGLFARVKFLFAASLLLLSFALIGLGAVLAATVVGLLIGVPLILLGFLPLWLLVRLASSGKKGTVVFRKF